MTSQKCARDSMQPPHAPHDEVTDDVTEATERVLHDGVTVPTGRSLSLSVLASTESVCCERGGGEEVPPLV